MKHKFKSYLQFGIFLFGVGLMIYSCQKDDLDNFDQAQQTKINPYDVSLSKFKEQTKINNLKGFLKTKFNNASNKQKEDLTFDDFIIDTTLVKLYLLDSIRPSFSFKITLKNSVVIGENYNLFIRQKDSVWVSSIMLFVDDNDTSNDMRFSHIEELHSLDGIHAKHNTQSNNASAKGGWSETTYYHCTNSGECSSGVCDLCSLCTSTSTTYIPDFTTQGDNGDDDGSGTVDGGMYNDGGGGAPSYYNPNNTEEEDDDDDCNTSKKDLKKVFPNTSDDRLQEIADAINDHAKDFGIDTKEELQHFISQAGHESANFTDFTENLNYRVKKLGINYWKSKFNPYTAYIDSLNIEIDSTKQNPNDYASSTSTVYVDNEEFANFVYDDANRGTGYKIGNTSDGDGYKYRGRGIFQLTGKTNYSNFNTYYQDNVDDEVDLLENPDLVASDKEIAVISALWFYKNNVLDEITVDSTTTVKKVTKKVNGKDNGLEDRKDIFEECEEHIDCVE